MNKADIAAAVADRIGLSRSDAARAVDAVFGIVAEAIQDGDDVRILGFGTFATTTRPAGVGRNPGTGEAIELPAARQIRFKPAQGLKDYLNL